MCRHVCKYVQGAAQLLTASLGQTPGRVTRQGNSGGSVLGLPCDVEAVLCVRKATCLRCGQVDLNAQVPTQDFFTKDFGMPLYMEPNFEDLSCKMIFGQAPPPLSDDPVTQQPCFSRCAVMSTVLQQIRMAS